VGKRRNLRETIKKLRRTFAAIHLILYGTPYAALALFGGFLASG
jgi:hypothetical protein